MWKSEGAQGNVYGEAPLLHSQDRPYWRPGLEPNCKSREFLIRLSLTARQFFYTVRERVRPFQGVYSFPGGSEGKESACNAGDLSSIPGSGRSLREGNGNPFQNSCLENSMDRGAWWAIVHGIAESDRIARLTLSLLLCFWRAIFALQCSTITTRRLSNNYTKSLYCGNYVFVIQLIIVLWCF